MEETVGQHLKDKQNKIFENEEDQLKGIIVKLKKGEAVKIKLVLLYKQLNSPFLKTLYF